jgi:RNA polymerase sigma-70 factor, ECF subfamily
MLVRLAKSVERGLKQADKRSAQSAPPILAGKSSEETDLLGFDQSPEGRGEGAASARSDGQPRDVQSRDGEPDEAQAGLTSEDELVSRSLSGDQDAFEVLVRRNHSRVFSIIGSFFRRRDVVEDIAQEVFSKAFFSLYTFTLGRSFEAWVARIAVNACYDHLRSQRRRIEQQVPHESQVEDEWLELQMLEVARDRHLSSERQRDAAEIAERLLAKLDAEDRLVVVLMDRDGFSVKEVSEMTGWGESKVKVRAFRARRTLRAAMKRLVMSGERMQRSKQEHG